MSSDFEGMHIRFQLPHFRWTMVCGATTVVSEWSFSGPWYKPENSGLYHHLAINWTTQNWLNWSPGSSKAVRDRF